MGQPVISPTPPHDPWIVRNTLGLTVIGIATTTLVAVLGIPGPIDGLILNYGRTVENPDATLKVATGLAAAFLAIAALGRYELTRMSHSLAEKSQGLAKQSQELAKQTQASTHALAISGQITERFVRAVEMLSNDSLDSRLGGIYSLERIAKDSEADAQTVIDVLCAFLREHAPGRPPDSDDDTDGSAVGRPGVSTDTQAALTVIGRSAGYFADRHLELEGADLAGANLAGADLSKANLGEAILGKARLDRADLSSANLYKANLTDANLTDADLTDADLSLATLTRARLDRADLSGATLYGVALTSAILGEAKLAKADLSGANLSLATLTGANLSEVGLFGARLTKARLDRADLSRANLTLAGLGEADLSGADLGGANLGEADLAKAILAGADLGRANLGGANLGGANLTDAHLGEANLGEANLTEVDRFLSKLTEATLDRVDLQLADLAVTNLTDENLGEANLAETKWDPDRPPTWPAGFDPPENTWSPGTDGRLAGRERAGRPLSDNAPYRDSEPGTRRNRPDRRRGGRRPHDERLDTGSPRAIRTHRNPTRLHRRLATLRRLVHRERP